MTIKDQHTGELNIHIMIQELLGDVHIIRVVFYTRT